MKNNSILRINGYLCYSQIFKLILLISLLFLANMPIQGHTWQDIKISVMHQDQTLGRVIDDIEAKSGYSVLIRNNDIDLDTKVTINMKNESLDTILGMLFKNKDVAYTISDKRISIYKPQQSVVNQRKTIKGKVTDEEGEPIIGASISSVDGKEGTLTDLDGLFSIEVANATTKMRVGYIGYQSQTTTLGNSTYLNIVLKEDAQLLDEVVVVGYGVQKKSVVTAAISSVKSEELGRVAPTRIDNVLKGMVSGVSITQASGQPGDGSRIRIRGVGTINNSEPLYIVDGMPIGGGIDYLNPADIESVEILKDAASAAVYGARGANGVILVATKQGEAGKTTLNYNFSYGWQNIWKKRKVLNATEYALLINEMRMNDGDEPIYQNPYAYGEGTDWQKEVLNSNAPIVEHQVSISGGNNKGNYYLSFGYLYHEGIVGGNLNRSNYDRYSARFNNTYTVWDESKNRTFIRKLRMGSNISYSRTESMGVGTNSERGTPLGTSLAISPILSVYANNPEELLNMHPTAVTDQKGRPFTIVGDEYGNQTNPVAQLHLPGGKGESDKIIANIWGELEILKELKLKSSYGADLSFWGDNGYEMPFYLGRFNHLETSSVWSSMNRAYTWQVENTLSYSHTFNKVHNIAILLGQSAQSSRTRNLGGQSYLIRDPSQPYIDATDQEEKARIAWGSMSPYHKLASYFGRASYNFEEKYMAEFTLRRDGSSNFGPKNRWAIFPSISMGWNITNEKFMESRPDFLSNLKLRLSWGQNGNQSIGEFMYTSMIYGGSNYILGPEGANVLAPGATPGGYTNPKLKWEESEQYNVGLDGYLFNGAISFGIDWYKKKTNGMLMTVPLPQYIGDSRPTGNVGDMQNTGIEIDLSYKTKINQVSFKVGGNASYNKNKLIKLGNQNGWANYDNIHGGIGTITRAENRQPFPFFYGMKTAGIFQTQEQINNHVNERGEMLQPAAKPGDVIFKDVNGDGIINEEDRTKIGKGMPDWTFGFNFGAEWKGFDINAFFHAVVGNEIYDASKRSDYPYLNMPKYMLDRWTGPGTSNKIPRLSQDIANSDAPYNNWMSSDLYVHNGSFLRLRSLQLGYTLPKTLMSKMFVNNLRVYLNAENLFILTKYHGFDPEISSGGTSLSVDRGVYPQPRILSIGANVTF